MRRRMHCTAGALCAAGVALASALSAAAASAGTSARLGTSAAQGTAHLSSAASSAQATRPSAAGAGRAPTSRAASALPVNYSFATGFAENFASPSAPPPGANNFSCQPSSAHPYPVILAHGTFGNMNDNWQAASPVLANHGYCVFAFNYGGASANADFQGTGERTSARWTRPTIWKSPTIRWPWPTCSTPSTPPARCAFPACRFCPSPVPSAPSRPSEESGRPSGGPRRGGRPGVRCAVRAGTGTLPRDGSAGPAGPAAVTRA